MNDNMKDWLIVYVIGLLAIGTVALALRVVEFLLEVIW